MSVTIFASCAFRSERLPSASTRTGYLIFPDAVDAAGEMILGAERGLEEAVDDLAVGEGLLFRALTRCDRRNFGHGNGRPDHGVAGDRSQGDREHPSVRRSVHRIDAAAIGACTQGVIASTW